MEVVTNNYMPGDPRLVEQLVYELKSQGIFDQFRKECIADVDTKPAYQNLRQRVEGSVTSFLKQLTWKPDMNKNQLREQLRKSIYESGYLDTGVERVVDQVVNPKINSIFLPQVEDVVYRYLGIEKPNRLEVKKELKIDVTDLLPTDLEAISPESDHTKDDSFNFNDSLNSESKMEEDESPPFEPIDVDSSNIHQEENSVDSHLSGFSGLQSHDSNPCMEPKVCPMELSNQDSQASQNSSESRLSIITSEDNTKMEIREDSNPKLLKSSDSNSQIDVCSLKTQISSDQSSEMKDEIIKATDTTDSNSDYNGSVEKNLKKEEDENEPEKPNDVDKNKQIDEKQEEDKKCSERKSDDKKSKSSDKYSSKDKKDDKYRKSSGSSSKEKEKSSSKYSSSSSKEKDKIKDKRESKNSSNSSNKDKIEKDKNDKNKDKIKSEKDKDISEKDKDRDRKEKEKSERDKIEKSERDKTEKSKSVKEKDKSLKDKDKMKSSSSSSSSTSKYNSNKEKDKNSTSVKSDSSKKDKEKSRSSSSTSSKDKSKSNNSDSKSKSSSSDKHKKEDKSTNSVKYSSSSSSSKKDKDKKKDSKKEVKDDHYSSKDKKNDRRSTDRDSNDGRSGKQSQTNSFSESNSSQTQKSSQDSSNSTSGSGSGDSGTSDQSEHVIKSPVNTAEHNENKESPVSYLDTQKFKYIKPKFASNFQEARKLMKIRKQLAKLERHNQLSLAQIEVPTEVPLVNGINCTEEDSMSNIVEEKSDENNDKDNETDDYVKESLASDIVESEMPPKGNSLVLQSRELSKENWEALEARLAQEMSNVNYNSYESPYDDYDYTGCNSVPTSPQKTLSIIIKPITQVTEGEKDVHSDSEKVQENVEIPAASVTEMQTKPEVEENGTIAETETDDKCAESPASEDAAKKISKDSESADIQINNAASELTSNIESGVTDVTETREATECDEDGTKMIIDINKVDSIENPQPCESKSCDSCFYLEPLSPRLERNLQFLYRYIDKLEQDVKHSLKTFQNNFVPLKERSVKRKLTENVDLTNNNKAHYEQTTDLRKRRKTVGPNPNSVISKGTKEKLCNSSDISPNDSFSLPLSPAESDKSIDKKEEELPKAKQKREPVNRSVNARSQRYSSEDLYKPRPTFISSRRSRGAKNLEK